MFNLFHSRSPARQLFKMIEDDDIKGVRREIGGKLPVDTLDGYGRSALCLAAKLGHTEIVEFLIASGADVNIVGKGGKTPVFYAIFSGSRSTLKVILKSGARLDVVDDGGISPTEYARGLYRPQMLELLNSDRNK